MDIRPIDLVQDYPVINEWYIHRYGPFNPDELPDIGFMIYTESKPILCGFLVTTNAKFAYIEMICSNPDSTDEERQMAIKLLDIATKNKAKELGYKRILIFPYIMGLMRKAEAVGYKFHKNKCYIGVKEL